MKRDPLKEALDRLKLVAYDSGSAASRTELERALTSKYDQVVAKAAELVGRLRMEALAPQLVASFERFMKDGGKADRGCVAKVALIEALFQMDARAEQTFLQGLRHTQLDVGYGGTKDCAGELRGLCALGLVRCSYPEILNVLVEVLVDPDPGARAMAATAVGNTLDEAGVPLLRFKVLIGHEEPEVMSAAFSALLKLNPETEVRFLERFLDATEEVAEAAALALGDSRQPSALELLLRDYESKKSEPLLLAIAMTRLPRALEFLMALVAGDDTVVAQTALEATRRIYQSDITVTERLRALAEQAGLRYEGSGR